MCDSESLLGMAPGLVASEMQKNQIQGANQSMLSYTLEATFPRSHGRAWVRESGSGSRAAGLFEFNRKVTSWILPLGSLNPADSTRCPYRK